jgi:hypothetical protein
MTTFPALVPSSRTFTPGEYPATAFSGFSGAQNRVRHSNVFLSAQLRLTFLGLTQAQMLDIWNHYNGRRGEFRSFDLPAEVASYGSITDYVPGNYLWRYAGPGSVEDLPCGGHNVSLTLETVPPIAASVVGADLFLRLRLRAGVADGGEYVPGISETITLSVAGGDAFTAINGISETIGISLESGEAAGDVSVFGIGEGMLLLLETGTASALSAVGITQTISITLTTTGAQSDPNFASVQLLLHMDGSNGSTTFIDTSPSPRTVTAVGNAQIDTSQAKFGTASAKFDGNGDALTVPYASAWDFGSGNFTVEGWVRPRIAVTTRMNLVSIFDATNKGWGIAILDTGKLRGFVEGASLVFIGPGPTTVADSVWHHFAMVRNGNNFAIYLNGAQEATATSSLALGTGSPQPLQIGAESSAGTRYLDGWLDDIRITKGVARYTSAFTPPAAPFPDF